MIKHTCACALISDLAIAQNLKIGGWTELANKEHKPPQRLRVTKPCLKLLKG